MNRLCGHCDSLEDTALEICENTRNGSLLHKMNKKKRKTKNGNSSTTFLPVATDMLNLLQLIKQMAGQGVGHIFSLNFVQLASCFGFLPTSMMNYSSVASTSSGGYKLIKHLYENNTSESTRII